jgi:hypothetical protein
MPFPRAGIARHLLVYFAVHSIVAVTGPRSPHFSAKSSSSMIRCSYRGHSPVSRRYLSSGCRIQICTFLFTHCGYSCSERNHNTLVAALPEHALLLAAECNRSGRIVAPNTARVPTPVLSTRAHRRGSRYAASGQDTAVHTLCGNQDNRLVCFKYARRPRPYPQPAYLKQKSILRQTT